MLFFIFVCIVCTDDEHLPPNGLHTRRGADPNLSSTLWWSPCSYCLIAFFWHSFNCNVVFCMLSLIPFVLVLYTRWYDDTKAWSTSLDLWFVDWRPGHHIVTCMTYALGRFMLDIYLLDIYFCLLVCNVYYSSLSTYFHKLW